MTIQVGRVPHRWATMSAMRTRSARLILACTALAAVSLVGCSGSDDQTAATTSVPTSVAGDAGRNAQISTDVDITASLTDGVVVREVVLPKPGYVGVYEDGNGAPGRRLGQSDRLEAGANAEIRVPIDTTIVEPTAVWVILHGEDNGNTTLDFPDADAPVELDGSVLTVKIPVAG